MRVLIATGLYPPDIGGPATYTKLLEDELPKRGIDVDVLAFGEVRHLPKIIKHITYFFKALKRAGGADIVYAQDATSVGWPAYLAVTLRGRKFVVKIVGDQTWEQGRQRFSITEELDDFPRFNWRWHPYLWFLRTLQLWVVRGADAIVTPSNYLAGVITGWGIDEERIHVLPNGVTLPPQYTEPQERPQGTLIVSIGRLVPWKGLTGLIDAVAAHDDWYLVIVGDGPQRAELEARAAKRRAQERVTFAGLLPHAEALGWARVADVFVLNSTYEGLSHTLIEVMALGTPIVATDIPGNREVVTDGVNGTLVPPGNSDALRKAIMDICTYPDDANGRLEQGKLRAQEFATERTMEQLATFLKSL